jgi:hypothetical protein
VIGEARKTSNTSCLATKYLRGAMYYLACYTMYQSGGVRNRNYLIKEVARYRVDTLLRILYGKREQKSQCSTSHNVNDSRKASAYIRDPNSRNSTTSSSSITAITLADPEITAALSLEDLLEKVL